MNSFSPKAEPRRIHILIRSLGIGGAERQSVELSKGLAAKGYRVTLTTFYSGGALADELAAGDVELVSLAKGGRWDVVRFAARLIRHLRRTRPDTLYTFLGVPNLISVMIRPLLHRLHLVWSVRASDVDLAHYGRFSQWAYRVERLLARRADLIVSNSHVGALNAVKNGFPEAKIRVVPNGIDTDRFKPDAGARQHYRHQWNIPQSALVIGILARLDPMKDHQTFLRAAAKVAAPNRDLRFVCLGEGPADYLARLQALELELGLAGRVVWAGACRDPGGALTAFDLCCSSSSFGEGFSNSVGEAMACGVPCVVTDVGDSALIVGDTGEIAPRDDPDALAAALARAIDRLDAPARDRARQRIVDNFSINEMVEETARLLDLAA